MPPMPIAASRLIAPVEIPATRTCGESAPIRMMDPFPHVFSIWVIARFSALRRSSVREGGEDLAGCCSAMVDLCIGGEPPLDPGPYPGLRPEYKPKLLLPPSGTERVLDVL